MKLDSHHKRCQVFLASKPIKMMNSCERNQTCISSSSRTVRDQSFSVSRFTLAGNMKLGLFKGKTQTTSSWNRTDPLSFFFSPPAVNTKIFTMCLSSFWLLSQDHNTRYPSSPVTKVILKGITKAGVNFGKKKKRQVKRLREDFVFDLVWMRK